MRVYCVTVNDPIRLVYLGTSVEEAEEAVGADFSYYQKDESQFPVNFPESYTVIPQILNPKMIQYYMSDGWWCSIVMFELKETDNAA